jgi:CHAD domain-containing protein
VNPVLSPAIAPEMVGQFLVALLEAFDTRMKDVGSRVLATGDAEAVHDFRVALRRTRTVLEIGRSVFGRFHTDEVREALSDLQAASGALRDEEVLLELLSLVGIDDPEAKSWIDARLRRERRLRSAMRRKIRAGDLDRGRRLLGALIAFRVKPSRDKRLVKFARRAVEDARREVERRRSTPVDDPEGLHRLRIAYKRLRYTADTFARVLPGELASLAQPAARFQSRLGQLHDVDVAIACVQKAPALLGGGRQALLIELGRIRRDRVAAFEQEVGATTLAPDRSNQAAGGASLRKISTR